MQHKKTISLCLITAIGMLTWLPGHAEAESISDLQSKRQSIQGDISQKQAAREQTRAQKAENAKNLDIIQGEIASTKARIGALSNDIAASQSRIDVKMSEIKDMQKRYDERRALLDKRLIDIYKSGDRSFLEVLLQAEDFSDLLTRVEYMSYIADNDQKLLKEIAGMKAKLEKEKASLEAEKSHYSQLKSEQEVHKNGLVTQEADKKRLAESLSAEEAQLSSDIAQMSAASEAIGAQIAEIQRREAAERARLAQMQQGQLAAGQLPFSGQSIPSTVSTSGYMWPVPSSHSISSPYGPRLSPFGGYEFHMGTDIVAPMGTPVVASRSGKIIIQVFHPSYGNYIVVDHGDGVSTVYAHLSAFVCAPGAQVNAGQVIGLIGSTGASTGAHLHFEVRINGQHTNPLAFIG